MGLVVLSMGAVAGADKVLVVYDPWSSIPALASITPAIFGLPNTNNNRIPMTSSGRNWWTVDFGATAPTQGFSILNEGTYAKGGNWHEYTSGGYDTNMVAQGSRFTLDAQFAVHDTIWMVPDPLNGGPPRFLYSQPKQITVLFWNPWENSGSGQPPRIKADSLGWASMDSVPSQPGWYSHPVIGFTHLDLSFQSGAGTQSLGASGIVAGTNATPVRFDTLLSRNDTVWIHQVPELSGPPVGQSTAPKAVVVDFFNPWDSQYPLVRATAQFADGYKGAGQPLLDHCGWFRIVRYDLRPASILFSGTGTWGAGGAGSTIPFDLSAVLALGDTVRVGPDSAGQWQVGSGWTVASGQCFLSKLAATIRDFDPSHPGFEHAYACGVTPGMVLPALGADGTPTLNLARGYTCGDSTLSQWFHDNPKIEYTTCTDIPLALSSSTDVYSYDNQHYFPIDSIPVSADPHNIQFPGDDGLNHNFSFCLESHAVFEYHTGQKFDFIGDDDVWVYINKKLVVDLGGVHEAAAGSVALDSMGLTLGKTYPFDFFFCERHTLASHMKISTSLNLRNIPDYEIRESDPSSGVRVFDLWTHQSHGQGCAATKIDKLAPGKFVLSGAGLAVPVVLPLGASYGGITVRGDSAEVTIDSAALADLVPGTYNLRIQFVADSTQYKDVTFVVPVTGYPVFVSHQALAASAGSTLETDVREVMNGVVVLVPQPFRLRQATGITWCADSACMRVLGPSDTLMTGLNGVRQVWVRGDSIGTYTLVVLTIKGDSSDTRSARFLGNAPDSAVWTDLDGDGRADHVRIWLHNHWTAQSQIRVSWPDTTFWIGPTLPGLVVSVDSMVLNLDVPGGRPGTSASTTDLGRWNRDGNPWESFPIYDRVPPVPTKAILYRGTDFDTLRVWPSEPILDFQTGDDVLRKRAPDGTLPKYAFSQEWRDPATGVLVLVFPATASPVPMPGDSVRFPPGGKTMDLFGNVPGAKSKSVLVLGTDRPPYDAVMLDTDGDGRADEVVLRFAQPPITDERWIFRWPSDSGGLDLRLSATGSATTDSGGRILTFRLPPYDFGSTSCPASGCGDLGSIVASNGVDSAVTSFAIRDGVAPVPVRGTLRYAGTDGAPDTLTAYFSEPVHMGSDTSSWIAWGPMVQGSTGNILGHYRATLDSTSRIATFYVDTFVVPIPGDGIRLNTPGNGGLLDSVGNGARDTAAWTLLELGPIPPRLGLQPYRTIRKWDGQPLPASEPPLQIFVHGGKDGGPWSTVDGSALPDTSRLLIAVFRMNGATDAMVYIYDNAGVFVAKKGLDAVKQAFLEGKIPTDSRGNYEVAVSWDGKSGDHMAASGIYIMRMVAWRSVGTRRFTEQKLVRLGWIVR
jgi:fibro-slime domain-containing protein